MRTATTDSVESDQEIIEQFIKDSGVLIDIRKLALNANLLRIDTDQGFELLRIRHDHHPVVELPLSVGNENEKRSSLRCRSMVCDLLRSAGKYAAPPCRHT